MLLLIKKGCPFCDDIEKIAESMRMQILYVENGNVILDNKDRTPLDSRVKGLPALVNYEKKVIIMGEKKIKNFLKTGEVNERS